MSATSHAPSGEVWLTEDEVKQMGLKMDPVRDQTVEDTIATSGRIAFDDSQVTHVFSPVAGRITRIDAALGQKIAKGATLAVVQAPDIGIASSDLGKAQADSIAAEHELKRSRDLHDNGAGSVRDIEIAEDNYRRARAELDRARQRVELFRAGSIDTVTQSYTIRSMIDGEVVARAITPGMEIQGQYAGGNPLELFTIGNLDRVWALGDVFEMDMARVKLGARVTMRVVAYPDRVFEGRVDWVSETLDPQTRTARVRCTFENADHALRPEMFATMSIETEAIRALAISRDTLLRLGEATVVFAHEGRTPNGKERFVRVPVVVDETVSDKWLPVIHGLDPNTPVVSNNAIQLVGLL